MRPRLSVPSLPLRAGWSIAARAYDLFSPIGVRPRVPGVVGLLGIASDDDDARGATPEPAASAARSWRAAGKPDARAATRQEADPDQRLADPILLLEGETGARVVTAFLVENERPEAVSAAIDLSPFTDAGGNSASPVATVTPSVLELGPGEQALVQVAAVLGPELTADVRYVARISIPGLSETTVPIAARRRVAEAA